MTFQEFAYAMRQRWRIVVAMVILGLAVMTVITIQTPRVYESYTRIYLLATGVDDRGNLYSMPQTEKETLVQVAASPVILDATREALGYDGSVPVSIGATASGETSLLDFRASSDSPERAAEIATTAPQVLAGVARNYAPSLAMSGNEVEAQVVAPATRSALPVTPDVRNNLITGVLGGLLVGIGLALLRHTADNRIRGSRELAMLSDRPLLAMIPITNNNDDPGHDLYMEADPFGPQAEAARQLRTNIHFVDVTAGKHSFMITSSLPGEGKTTTAVNLGLAIADSGLKVLLIDADLRHPNVANALGIEGAVGLTTLLVGAAKPEDVIQQWAGTSLHVLAAGEAPPNPSELLGSRAMKELFEQLSEEFDFILVDSPPVLPVTDPLVISQLTGGVVMVVAATETRRRHLAEALRVLKTANVEVGGFVVTKAESTPSSYRYYYGSNREQGHGEPTTRREHSRRQDRGRRKRTAMASQRAPRAREAAESREQRESVREPRAPIEHVSSRHSYSDD
ncbi:polysaccharide biosynthesis tyrosine autokinase [Ornithinimicrobium cryptoxanthini]|uniref:polysaccharide biosynthesis tyrosine autokinase n=1 Tax=Ornithinimicrobium cryptoxanthini TaxID=2934161 RepID=UPI0021188CC3|nr:polysaccharide biosynthesis tyrosine autokinase [Ornithinimicrobium cryptoxanthini]